MSHGGCHAQVKSPHVLTIKKARRFRVELVLYIKPGSDLLSHGNSHTIIGAELFHFCVRDGNRWDQLAMAARHNWLAYFTGKLIREVKVLSLMSTPNLLGVIWSSLTGN